MDDDECIVAPPSECWRGDSSKDQFTVSLTNDFGKTYPWAGQWVHPDYAEGRWRLSGRVSSSHTAIVMATFLNVLRPMLAERGWFDV